MYRTCLWENMGRLSSTQTDRRHVYRPSLILDLTSTIDAKKWFLECSEFPYDVAMELAKSGNNVRIEGMDPNDESYVYPSRTGRRGEEPI